MARLCAILISICLCDLCFGQNCVMAPCSTYWMDGIIINESKAMLSENWAKFYVLIIIFISKSTKIFSTEWWINGTFFPHFNDR